MCMKNFHYVCIYLFSCLSGFREINLSTQKNQSVSYKAMHFDLNVAPDDESLANCNDNVPTVLSSSIASLVIQPLASVNSLAGSQSFISFSRESSTKHSKETSTGVQPVDSRSASKMTINSLQGCQVSHHSGMDASVCNAQVIIKGASDNNQQNVENGHHDSDSDAPLKLQMNSAGFGGEVQDNVTGKMLTGILGIEVRNLVLSSGEQIHHAHSAIRQQISNVTSSNNAEDTNLPASVGSAEQPPAVTRDSENKQTNFEGSEEDTLSSHTKARDEEQQEKCSKEIPVESKFDNERCSGDVCVQTVAVIPSSTEESGTTQTESQVLESYPIKHPLVSQTCHPPIIVGKSKHEDEPEGDSLIFLAAKTLFSISSHKPECVTDPSSGFGQTELEAEGNAEPQYSSDSFETLTMMLPENTTDEYTMPRIPADKVSGNDTCGVKLRRGRGLRDFQKDILPGLTSLSRHEICEDFHNIQHALRKSRSRNRENWPVPVRSRRSRRCSSNRRHL